MTGISEAPQNIAVARMLARWLLCEQLVQEHDSIRGMRPAKPEGCCYSEKELQNMGWHRTHIGFPLDRSHYRAPFPYTSHAIYDDSVGKFEVDHHDEVNPIRDPLGHATIDIPRWIKSKIKELPFEVLVVLAIDALDS